VHPKSGWRQRRLHATRISELTPKRTLQCRSSCSHQKSSRTNSGEEKSTTGHVMLAGTQHTLFTACHRDTASVGRYQNALTAQNRSMEPRESRPDAARSKNSFCRSGYLLESSWPYMSHEPTVFSRSCTKPCRSLTCHEGNLVGKRYIAMQQGWNCNRDLDIALRL
jgi:hypothetical protein